MVYRAIYAVYKSWQTTALILLTLLHAIDTPNPDPQTTTPK